MAPSPTGYVHLGSARTALYNLLFARARGGTFVLRVDDTDVERNRDEYESAIYDGFDWLGIDYDESPRLGGPYGPYRQSERIDSYRDQAIRLLESGAAYRCFCTPAELTAEREAAAREHRPYRYSRRCLTDPPRTRAEFTVRLRVPDTGAVEFTDLVRGPMRFENCHLGDPIIVKSDGYPTYNFASPVDDALMAITHVIRGEEHLSNTHVQLLVLDSLGLERPQAFAHLPVILAPDGRKLSKRHHPEANLLLYRERGYLPEALLNYIALLGWNPGTEQEIFSRAELEAAFDLTRVQKSGAVFDWKKLDWINGSYIRALPEPELVARLGEWVPELAPAQRPMAAAALRERLIRFADARELLAFLWREPAPAPPKPEEVEKLAAARDVLATSAWDPASIEAALDQLLAARGWSRARLFNPLREAVAGKVTPPIHYTLALLPKEVALARIEKVITQP